MGIVESAQRLCAELGDAAARIGAVGRSTPGIAAEVGDALRGSQRDERDEILGRARWAEGDAGRAEGTLREAADRAGRYAAWHGGR